MELKLYRFFIALLCFLFGLQSAYSQETKVTKVYEKTFDIEKSGEFELLNKYGELDIKTWDRNQAKVSISIEAYGKDAFEANKQIDRVEFDFRATTDYISIVTVIDRNSGFFKEMLNSISDYSNNLMSRSKIKVDYKVFLPSTASLKLHNKFGDVFIDQIDNRVDIDVAHGNLKSEGFTEYARLKFGFGTARIKFARDLDLELKGGNLILEEAVKLDITSSSSDISINNVNDIYLRSTNDQYRINELNKLSGSANFSHFDLGYMHSFVKLNQNYGSLKLNSIDPAFTDISLVGKSTDYFVLLPDFADIQVDLTVNEERLSLPQYRGELIKTAIDDRGSLVNYKGYIGGMPPQNRRFSLSASNGDVIIDFAFSRGMENTKRD